MREIQLTKGYIALVDDEDYERVNQYKWYAKTHKKKNTVYAGHVFRDKNKRKEKQLHRFILNLTDSKVLVDHVDRNGLNNQKYNLRTCTKAQNAKNIGILPTNTSGYTGIHFDKCSNKWRAGMKINNKRIYIGIFTDKKDAIIAYNNAVIKYSDLRFKQLNPIPNEFNTI